jgi:hypothetical protein
MQIHHPRPTVFRTGRSEFLPNRKAQAKPCALFQMGCPHNYHIWRQKWRRHRGRECCDSVRTLAWPCVLVSCLARILTKASGPWERKGKSDVVASGIFTGVPGTGPCRFNTALVNGWDQPFQAGYAQWVSPAGASGRTGSLYLQPLGGRGLLAYKKECHSEGGMVWLTCITHRCQLAALLPTVEKKFFCVWY